MKRIIISIVMAFTLMLTGSYAASNFQKIDVLFDSIAIKVNGQNISTPNILYNGTTYVPLRAVSEALHKNVGYDEKTRTAKIDDISQQQNPTATIQMQNGDIIKVELYPQEAPETVKNFISLADKGFYNGLTFHRIVPGFVIQGGDPKGNGSGGPGYSIKGEFMQNGVRNTIMHTRGVISMARSSNPDSGGSQFFIVLTDAPHLNGEYAAFGKVIDGMDTVDKIASVKTGTADAPLEKQVIKSITITSSKK